jgi:tRNA(adenine34) deaminase
MERRPWRLRFADLEETLRVEQASKAIRTIEKSACRFSPTFLTNRHARKRPACGLVLFWRCMPENIVSDVEFMRSALAEAREAAERGEVPIGAVLALDNRVIAGAGNRTISDCDPTAHAEIVALRAASKILGNYRLLGTTLYVTIEPCAMCCGAMIQARISRLVYGADDAKAGAVRSCFSVLDHRQLNHRVAMTSGVLAEDSAAILKEFFSVRR